MNEDTHVGGFASALVMLAAIGSTFLTYGYYKDDELANQYEADQVSLENTASALVALRIQEEAMIESASTTTKEKAPELE
ncbi:MAG TPA: hypothetical protein VJH67_03560 [Candidatus Paceibacterota bacterium]